MFPSLAQDPEFIALEQKKADYIQQLNALVVAKKDAVTSWSQEYLKELEVLTERRRTAGDFEGWATAQEERKKFAERGEIDEQTNEATDDITDLRLLKSRFRQLSVEQRVLHNRRLITLSKKYITELTERQRTSMQGGQMNIASAINAEIRRVRALPQYLEAERDAQATSVAGETEKLPTTLPASGDQSNEQDLAKQREVFEQKLAEIESSTLQASGQWAEHYLEELNVLMERFQRAGDYVGWETVREETARFEADRVLLPRHFVSQQARLLELQNKYYQLRDMVRKDKAKKIVEATEKHVATLQKYQKALTVKGQMSGASMVQAEINRIRSRLDFVEAQNLLATPPSETAGTNTVAGVREVKSEK